MKELMQPRGKIETRRPPLAKEVESFHRYGGCEDGNLGELVRLLGVRPPPKNIPEVKLGC